MLIIAGHLYVAPKDRDEFVASHEDLLGRARKAQGCLDLAICADPIEDGRVNMFELWESEESLDAWRAIANPPTPVTEFLGGQIQKYFISGTGSVF